MLQSFLQDARHGARLLYRSPLFAIVAVGSISCGLAVSLGIFTAANALIFRPLDRGSDGPVYRIYIENRSGGPFGGVSFADFRDFSTLTDVFASTCASTRVRANVEIEGQPEMRLGAVFSPDCFAMLGVRAAAGRLIQSASPASPEVVISFAMWRARFNSSPDAIGRHMLLNGVPATIVGVAERGFSGVSFDAAADFWVEASTLPAVLPPHTFDQRRSRQFMVLVRLRDAVTIARAESSLAGVAASLRDVDPAAWTTTKGTVRRVTVADEMTSRFATAPGLVAGILGTVGLAVLGVLAIACVNVATLLLARGASRTRELTIRLAVGASRGRLLRQLAVESLIIGLLGTLVAAAVTAVGVRLFDALRPAEIPALNIAIDWRVGVFAVGAGIIASVLFGVAPGIHVVRLAIAEGLKGRIAVVRTRFIRAGVRETLIVVQVAVSVAVLMAASVLAVGMVRGSDESPGFRTDGVAVLQADMSSLDERRIPQLAAGILRAVAAAPGIQGPVIANILPLTGSSTTFDATLDDGTTRVLESNIVSPGYFATMGIPLRSGRDFMGTDQGGSRPVAIASETLARTIWQTPDAIGRTLTIHGRLVEIVGVVADTRYRAVNEPFRPVIYLPFTQIPHARFFLHARFADGGALAAMSRAARSVDPTVLIDAAVPVAARLDEIRAPERAAQWMGIAGGTAQLGLVLMAVWALVAYAVERRRTEIGVRLALGATPAAIVRLIMQPVVVLIAAGVAIGTAGGIAAAALLQSEFVGLGSLNFAMALPALAAVAAAGAAAALVPARRATDVDPIVALRAD